MSCILYYSNFCDHSKKLLQNLSKSYVTNDVHFICIDKRIKDPNNGTIYVVLENGQKIVLPPNIQRVPALLDLKNNYNVLYGDSIAKHFKPIQNKEMIQATMNNMEPMAFSFGGGMSGIVSDSFSFLDENPEEMKADGNAGMRQMHNYVDLNTAFSGQISNYNNANDTNTTIRGTHKRTEDSANSEMEARMKQMQAERDADIKRFSANRPPLGGR